MNEVQSFDRQETGTSEENITSHCQPTERSNLWWVSEDGCLGSLLDDGRGSREWSPQTAYVWQACMLYRPVYGIVLCMLDTKLVIRSSAFSFSILPPGALHSASVYCHLELCTQLLYIATRSSALSFCILPPGALHSASVYCHQT